MPELVCRRDPNHRFSYEPQHTVRGKPIKEWFEQDAAGLCRECRSQPYQQLLFGSAPTGVAETIQEKFEQFHALNPWVYDELVRLARELRQQGHRRIGMKMLFEVLRYQYMRRTEDPASPFKLNNNYHSRFARLIMADEPDLADAFETRELQSA